MFIQSVNTSFLAAKELSIKLTKLCNQRQYMNVFILNACASWMVMHVHPKQTDYVVTCNIVFSLLNIIFLLLKFLKTIYQSCKHYYHCCNLLFLSHTQFWYIDRVLVGRIQVLLHHIFSAILDRINFINLRDWFINNLFIITQGDVVSK